MKTGEFVKQLLEYSEDINNKHESDKVDILRLVDHYTKLSKLDYLYLEKVLKVKDAGYFQYSYNGAYPKNSHLIFGQLYTKSGRYYDNKKHKMVKYGGHRGKNLYNAQKILREARKNLESKNQEFFEKNKLEYLFKSLDRLSFSGIAISDDTFVEYIKENISVAYDKFNDNKNYDLCLSHLIDLKYEVTKNKNYFLPVRDEEITFEKHGSAYVFNPNNECNHLVDLVNKIYNNNTKTYTKSKKQKENIKTMKKIK